MTASTAPSATLLLGSVQRHLDLRGAFVRSWQSSADGSLGRLTRPRTARLRFRLLTRQHLRDARDEPTGACGPVQFALRPGRRLRSEAASWPIAPASLLQDSACTVANAHGSARLRTLALAFARKALWTCPHVFSRSPHAATPRQRRGSMLHRERHWRHLNAPGHERRERRSRERPRRAFPVLIIARRVNELS